MPKMIRLGNTEDRQEETFKTLNTRQAKVRYLENSKTFLKPEIQNRRRFGNLENRQ
jgi:hypothetical protein